MSRAEDNISFTTNKKNKIKFKVVFIGDQAVGKSSIINRFIKNEFEATHNPTVGIDFVSKNMIVNQKSVRLQLWDTAGQQRFRSLIPGYLRDSNAIFVVYDVTNSTSYDNVNMWLDYIKQNRGDDVLISIVGNKIDIAEERSVSFQDAQERFKKMKVQFCEVSAKTGENLQTLFVDTCKILLDPNQQTFFNQTAQQSKQIKEEKQKTGVSKNEIIKDESKKDQGTIKIGESKTEIGVKQKRCC